MRLPGTLTAALLASLPAICAAEAAPAERHGQDFKKLPFDSYEECAGTATLPTLERMGAASWGMPRDEFQSALDLLGGYRLCRARVENNEDVCAPLGAIGDLPAAPMLEVRCRQGYHLMPFYRALAKKDRLGAEKACVRAATESANTGSFGYILCAA